MQREERCKLTKELSERKEKGEKVKIRNNKVVTVQEDTPEDSAFPEKAD